MFWNDDVKIYQDIENNLAWDPWDGWKDHLGMYMVVKIPPEELLNQDLIERINVRNIIFLSYVYV